jgi:hypothetical protein
MFYPSGAMISGAITFGPLQQAHLGCSKLIFLLFIINKKYFCGVNVRRLAAVAVESWLLYSI